MTGRDQTRCESSSFTYIDGRRIAVRCVQQSGHDGHHRWHAEAGWAADDASESTHASDHGYEPQTGTTKGSCSRCGRGPADHACSQSPS